MSEACKFREIVPWYVEGSLAPSEAAAMAAHLAGCDACLQEVAATLRVRLAVRDVWAGMGAPSPDVWRRVVEETGGRPLARLDVGSFLVGLEVGLRRTRRSAPLRGDLRVLNRRVPLFNVDRKGGTK
ncbi:MAG: zf-HC2 domain-containing protein [Candidatus Bipolaricaulota bacterium]